MRSVRGERGEHIGSEQLLKSVGEVEDIINSNEKVCKLFT